LPKSGQIIASTLCTRQPIAEHVGAIDPIATWGNDFGNQFRFLTNAPIEPYIVILASL
jgi:hypothetical protein